MSRFKPAYKEEHAARGLNPDRTPIKKIEPKKTAKSSSVKKGS